MKRWCLFVCLVSAVCLALPSIAGANTAKPTLVLEPYWPYCDLEPQAAGVRVGVTGFPPGAQFAVTFSNTIGGGATGTLTTDANGEWIGITGHDGVTGTFTWTVDSPYLKATKTITVTCGEPTSVEQCRNGGWRIFPEFKNQGQCVAFVKRGPGRTESLEAVGLSEQDAHAGS
jgi:hypothetical protein